MNDKRRLINAIVYLAKLHDGNQNSNSYFVEAFTMLSQNFRLSSMSVPVGRNQRYFVSIVGDVVDELTEDGRLCASELSLTDCLTSLVEQLVDLLRYKYPEQFRQIVEERE